MNIYVVANPSGNSRIQQKILLLESTENHLMSYAYRNEEPAYEPVLQQQGIKPKVIIDSGAFTAFTLGKQVDPKEYAEWALDFDKRWRNRMDSLHYMNLDVIGDQDASWINQSILEGLGMRPIPIVTFGADAIHLQRAVENYEYIALGGLVPHSGNRKLLQAWLDHCFQIVMTQYRKTGKMPKIHLLGITSDWAMKRYPCFSADSSSWVSSLRFGRGDVAGIQQVPRYKEGDAALAANIHVLRAAIRKYKLMETEATKLWATRGISW